MGHGERKPYNCEICDKSFFQRLALKHHILLQHKNEKQSKNDENRVLKLEIPRLQICKVPFKVKKGKNPFKCQTCDASFARQAYLNRHISTVHQKKRAFKCDSCDMSFAHKESLKS